MLKQMGTRGRDRKDCVALYSSFNTIGNSVKRPDPQAWGQLGPDPDFRFAV